MNPTGEKFTCFPPPKRITKGSRLAVVAPAGPFDRNSFDRGVAWLRERYEISYDESIFARKGYFAGHDDRRLAELMDAVNDPEIDGILCARGGFGTTRLLPGIDLEQIRSANKMIVGFSDITALHAAWTNSGVKSIHAPMVSALGNAPPDIRAAWIAALECRKPGISQSLDPIVRGQARGRLFGGNLAVICALLGTPFAPSPDGIVLLIEDVGERPYRIDRMLTSLRQAGWFDRIAGLVLGMFTEGKPGPDGVTLDEVFERNFESASFPVLRGLSSGHVPNNLPLTIGSAARIENQLLETS